MPHVLIPDSVDSKAIDVIKRAAGLTYDYPGKLTQEQLVAQVGEAEALIIRSGVKITREVFAAAPKLKAVARAGVGVDNIDVEAATEYGVVVMNTPGGNTISTAEHAFALMLALARQVPAGDASLRGGKWDRKSFMGVELRGKTLGVLGFGRIGQSVAKRALAFEMHVVAYDPFLPDEIFAAIGVERTGIDELYRCSDFITLHVPLLDDTRGMLNADAFALMKDGVRIINTARGALVNDADLAAAIQSGRVAGAALDVFEPEPPAPDNPLIGLPQVVHTPHLAASTSDAQVTVAIEAAELIADALLNGRFTNVVNANVLDLNRA